MKLEGLDHVAIAVRDVEESAQWYCEVLGLERQHGEVWGGVPTFVGKGATGIALFRNEKTSDGLPYPEKACMLHLALRADRENFTRAQRELKERGIAFHFADHEISHSIYFRDPDGHKIEITTYELT